MNLRLVSIFRAVIQHGTTAAAAKALNVSQPAVSKAIKKLESETGLDLFDRVRGNLVATEMAKVLYSESESIFLLAKALDRTMEELRDSPSETLKVVATPQLGHTVLPYAIQSIMVRYPHIRVYLDVRQSSHIIDILRSGAADIGFAIALEDELRSDLHMSTIGTVELTCLVPEGHPLGGKQVLYPTDITGYPFIGLEMGSRLGPIISGAFQDAGVPYRSSVEVRYSETACLLAKAGAGIAIVDQFSASTLIAMDPNFRAIPFRPVVFVDAFAVEPKGLHSRRLSHLLVDLTRDLVSKRGFSTIGMTRNQTIAADGKPH